MQLYYTDTSFDISASNLDNKRLIAQAKDIHSAVSTIINTDEDYKNLLFSLYNESSYEKVNLAFLKPTHLEHPVIKWIQKSPINLLYTLYFFNSVFKEYQRRYLEANKMSFACQIANNLAGALEKICVVNFYDIAIPVYDFPPDFTGLTGGNAIDNNKKYLISKWKEDIKKEFEYENLIKKWDGTDLESKPRKPRKLSWTTTRWFRKMPSWANEELVVFKEELYAK